MKPIAPLFEFKKPDIGILLGRTMSSTMYMDILQMNEGKMASSCGLRNNYHTQLLEISLPKKMSEFLTLVPTFWLQRFTLTNGPVL
jgi:hypothetical protein